MVKPKPQTPSPNDTVVGALILTRDQWVELVAAVHSKAISVRRGEYQHDSDFDNPEDAAMHQEKWAGELDELEKIITEALNHQGIGV